MSDHFHHPNELQPPPDAASDKEAGEVLRAWIVKGGLEVSLHPLAFPEIETWGLLLVDIARHVARACEMEGKGKYDKNLASIRRLLEAEFQRPTDLGTTGKVRPH
jgi:hypothetical protein